MFSELRYVWMRMRDGKQLSRLVLLGCFSISLAEATYNNE